MSVLLLAASLAGCSAMRIGYSQAPDLAYWWLDGYVDFNSDQTPKVRDALQQWFAWHRRTQLPDYAALLAKAEGEVRADTTAARACEWQVDLTQRAQTAFDRILPAAADFALSVTPQQIQYLERRYAKFNDDYRDEYLQPDPTRRADANLKRALDRIETLYGAVDDTQRATIANMLARSPFDADVWFAERRARQQDMLQLLRKLTTERASREQAQAALRGYTERLAQSPREPYRRYAERLMAYNCGFIASVQNAMTPAQRRTAADKLAGWEGDARALAAAPVDKPVDLLRSN